MNNVIDITTRKPIVETREANASKRAPEGEYNGHPSWEFWNVSLWIFNDEGLYGLAKDCVRGTPHIEAAAKRLLDELHSIECFFTPDGAPFDRENLAYALEDIED